MKIEFQGKTALVTGGSGGLGRKMVERLAECGANVIIHYYRDEASAKKLVEEVTSKYGVKAMMVQADLTKQADVIAMKDKVEREFTMPDLLVANAVVQYEWHELLDEKIENYYSQFESCVLQMVYLSQAFVPHMKEQKYGRIVAINTECSYMAEVTQSAYVAAKRGLDGVVRVLAKEVGPYNITVNQVAPGWTITDKERETGGNPGEDYVKTVPLGRRGEDMNIADMVTFFLSDYASFTTGAYIPVSGGRVMPGI